jgi:hypothetical protein
VQNAQNVKITDCDIPHEIHEVELKASPQHPLTVCTQISLYSMPDAISLNSREQRIDLCIESVKRNSLCVESKFKTQSLNFLPYLYHCTVHFVVYLSSTTIAHIYIL